MQKEREIAARLLAAGVENAAWEAKLLCEKFDGDALEAAAKKRQPLVFVWFHDI